MRKIGSKKKKQKKDISSSSAVLKGFTREKDDIFKS